VLAISNLFVQFPPAQFGDLCRLRLQVGFPKKQTRTGAPFRQLGYGPLHGSGPYRPFIPKNKKETISDTNKASPIKVQTSIFIILHSDRKLEILRRKGVIEFSKIPVWPNFSHFTFAYKVHRFWQKLGITYKPAFPLVPVASFSIFLLL